MVGMVSSTIPRYHTISVWYGMVMVWYHTIPPNVVVVDRMSMSGSSSHSSFFLVFLNPPCQCQCSPFRHCSGLKLLHATTDNHDLLCFVSSGSPFECGFLSIIAGFGNCNESPAAQSVHSICNCDPCIWKGIRNMATVQ